MTTVREEIQQLEMEMYNNYAKLQKLRAQVPPEEIKDYEFLSADNQSIKLSDMFDDQEFLYVVHNMGVRCSYCTLWADGLSAVYPDVKKHASFYLSSPDPLDTQRKIKEDHQWQFPMVSLNDNNFPDDLGYRNARGGYMPGISLFKKESDGTIHRINRASFGESDNFGILYHLFDLLPSNPVDEE